MHRCKEREGQAWASQGPSGHVVGRRRRHRFAIMTKPGKDDDNHHRSLFGARSRRGGEEDGNHPHAFPKLKADVVGMKAAGQRCNQVETLVHLDCTINSIGDVIPEINRVHWPSLEVLRQVQQSGTRQSVHRSGRNSNFLKAEVIEVVRYGCVTWAVSPDDCGTLRQANHRLLLKCLNEHTSTRRAPRHHIPSYHEVLEIIGCNYIEGTRTKQSILL